MSDISQDSRDVLVKESPKVLTQRFLKRLMGQRKEDLMVVLSRLFPRAQAMRIMALAEDLANQRPTAESGLLYLFKNEEYNPEMIKLIRSSVPKIFTEHVVLSSPTEFYVKIKCSRTPIKEFFEECRDYSCDECILKRVQSWPTFTAVIEKAEGRRADLCKKCGKLLGKNDKLEVKNERVYYVCSHCGHRGWNKL